MKTTTLETLQEMYPDNEVSQINDTHYKIDGAIYQESDDDDYEAQFEDIEVDGIILIKQ